MAGEGGAGRFAQPGYHVDHPGRDPHLLGQMTGVEGAQRGQLGRLDDDGVPGGQGGATPQAYSRNGKFHGKMKPHGP